MYWASNFSKQNPKPCTNRSAIRAPRKTHCLNTCHHDIRAAALWEAGLTFYGLPVTEASSPRNSREQNQQTSLTVQSTISLQSRAGGEIRAAAGLQWQKKD